MVELMTMAALLVTGAMAGAGITARLMRDRLCRMEWVQDGDAKYRHFTTPIGERIGTQSLAFNDRPAGLYIDDGHAAGLHDAITAAVAELDAGHGLPEPHMRRLRVLLSLLGDVVREAGDSR